ncbi:Os07g0259450, partial [Oryza sativa Japonica Group]
MIAFQDTVFLSTMASNTRLASATWPHLAYISRSAVATTTSRPPHGAKDIPALPHKAVRRVAGDHDVPEHLVPERRFVEHPAGAVDESGLGVGVGERGGHAGVGAAPGLDGERVDRRAGGAAADAGAGPGAEEAEQGSGAPHFVERVGWGGAGAAASPPVTTSSEPHARSE